jgi:predicted MPP superfamily phosphohydrolase
LTDFCLLHLSDFHLRASTQTQTDSILDSLVKDAQERLSSLDLPDPYIALSGDLAFGGREEDYRIVDTFVGLLKERLHPRRLEYCGGNHDVNRSLLPPISADLMNAMEENNPGSVRDTEKRFAVDSDRKALEQSMASYYSFLERHGIKSSNYLYYVNSTEVSNLKLNFISLNSAYIFSRKYNYYGYVGRQQMERAFSEVEDDISPSFNVTLVHHPIEALVPPSQEETKRYLFTHSDIILNGHVHSPRISVEYTANVLGRTKSGPPPVLSCARCIFDESDDPEASSGYSIVGVDFEYEKVSQIKIWEVQFDKSTGKYYNDEKKKTYPLVIKVGTAEQLGNKVTDGEKQFLSKWKRATP